MVRSGRDAPSVSPLKSRRPSSQGHDATAVPHVDYSGNTFDVLARLGPAVTMASFPLQPQAASVVTSQLPGIESLPDHLLQKVLLLASAHLRVMRGLPARNVVRAWTNLVCVSKRWAALLADEPIWLRVNTGIWPAILAALPASRLRLRAFEFYTEPEPLKYNSTIEQIKEADRKTIEPLTDLLASKEFQLRNGPHMEHLSANCGIPAASLLLSSRLPCSWSQLRHLSWLTVDPGSVHLLQKLPVSLYELHMTGRPDDRGVISDPFYPAVADTLSHVSSLRVLDMTCLHVASAQLPQALDRLYLRTCTRDASRTWPSGMSVRWEGPMDPQGFCSVLLMRDGTDVPTFWQECFENAQSQAELGI